jgi:hypothetical protein
MDLREAAFRRVESTLDELVMRAEQDIRSAAVRAEDRSARTYHYKNSHLFWSYTFLKEWRVNAERARITVSLTYGEPVNPEAPPEVEIGWRAELFQQGHESRIDERGKSSCALADIERQGIASLVKGAIREGTGD